MRQALPATARIRRTPRFEQLLSSFDLSPVESFLAYRVEGGVTTLESLRLMTGFPEEQILRLMFLLERIGAVHLVLQ
jgi:hypothetical protein